MAQTTNHGEAAKAPQRAGTRVSDRRGLRRLVATGLILVGCLVVAEVAVRTLVPDGRLLRLAQLDEALSGSRRHQFLQTIQDDVETFWRLAPNVELEMGAGPFFGRISNDQGLREREHIAAKKPGEIRILFLGDSCTFGYLLDERQTFVALTEERLREAFPGKHIECINAGVPGYTAFQCWRRLESEGFDYEPDLVVAQFGWNERIVWDGRSDPEHYRAMQACQPPGLLSGSRVAKLLWASYGWPGPSDDGRSRLAPAEFRRVLGRLVEATESRGVEFLLLLTGCRQNVRTQRPTSYQDEQLLFASGRKFGPDEGHAYIDGVNELTRLTLQEKRPVETYLFDEAHPTFVYSGILADRIVQKITPWLTTRLKSP